MTDLQVNIHLAYTQVCKEVASLFAVMPYKLQEDAARYLKAH